MIKKIMCIKTFLARSRRALEYLLDDLILTYKQNIDTNYQITDQQKKEIINDCIAAAMPT